VDRSIADYVTKADHLACQITDLLGPGGPAPGGAID
jgi:hypothetical protein